ncbi:MAG: hypothetical protein KAX69_02795 [Chitinophagales bacterium]|nr:hypothetical protein [Chitinophagales bacterium]
MKKYKSSFLLLLLGIWYAYFLFPYKAIKCYDGLTTAIFSLFIIVVYLVVFAFLSYKEIFSKESKNYAPIKVTFFNVLLLLLIVYSVHFESKSIQILKTYGYNLGGFEINLKDNNSYIITARHACYTCIYRGDYKVCNDTLFFDSLNESLLNKGLSDKYCKTKDKKYYVPFYTRIKYEDSLLWLKIY